jgi:hypothetical protein
MALTLEIIKMQTETTTVSLIPVTFYSHQIKLAKGDSWPLWVVGELPCRGDVIHSSVGVKGIVARRHFLPEGRIQISLNPEL